MLFNSVAILIASMVTFASAACNTGSIQCCKQVMDSESASFTGIATTLDIDLTAITGQVGVGCSAITVFGSGSSCNGQAVCCSSQKYDGLLNVGCIPAIVA